MVVETDTLHSGGDIVDWPDDRLQRRRRCSDRVPLRVPDLCAQSPRGVDGHGVLLVGSCIREQDEKRLGGCGRVGATVCSIL